MNRLSDVERTSTKPGLMGSTLSASSRMSAFVGHRLTIAARNFSLLGNNFTGEKHLAGAPHCRQTALR